jgi:hypothetical protein
MTLHKQYWNHPNPKNNERLKASISYDKSRHAYRCTVVPVRQTRLGNGMVMEEYGAFTGFNYTLMEVNRQSKSKLEEAIDKLEEKKEDFINYFKEK